MAEVTMSLCAGQKHFLTPPARSTAAVNFSVAKRLTRRRNLAQTRLGHRTFCMLEDAVSVHLNCLATDNRQQV